MYSATANPRRRIASIRDCTDGMRGSYPSRFCNTLRARSMTSRVRWASRTATSCTRLPNHCPSRSGTLTRGLKLKALMPARSQYAASAVPKFPPDEKIAVACPFFLKSVTDTAATRASNVPVIMRVVSSSTYTAIPLCDKRGKILSPSCPPIRFKRFSSRPVVMLFR